MHHVTDWSTVNKFSMWEIYGFLAASNDHDVKGRRDVKFFIKPPESGGS